MTRAMGNGLAALLLALTTSAGYSQPLFDDGSLTDAQVTTIQDLNLEVINVRAGVDGPRAYSKVTARLDSQIVDLALARDGRVLDENSLAAMVREYQDDYAAQWGRFDEDSRAVLSGFAMWEHVEAIVYPLVEAPPEPTPHMTEGLSTEEAEALWLAHKNELGLRRALARDQLIQSLDEAVDFDGRGIRVEGTRQQIEAIARRIDIAEVVLHDSLLPPPQGAAAAANQFIAFDTLRQGPVAWDGNGNGSKIKIGLIETGTGPNALPRPAPGNAGMFWPFVSSGCSVHADCGSCGSQPTDQANGCRCVSGQCWDNHGTRLASILASVDNGDRVGVGGAAIYYDNDSIFTDSIDWLAASDVHIMSLSQSGPSISSLARDEAVRFDNIALCNAAGNFGTAQNPSTMTTCRSPNVICVANYDINGSRICPTSNPANFTVPGNANFDREQPDVSAPGTSLRTFDSTGAWSTVTGTSIATPIVASVLASLHDVTKTNSAFNNHYPTFENYPEAAKAIIMAAATTNAANGPVSDHNAPDESDGAGVIDVTTLENIYNSGRWSIQFRTPSDPQSINLRSVNLTAGQTLRAYLAWSRCPSNQLDALNADLDLRIKAPNGQWVAFGDSWFQTYEVVNFTAQQTGIHEISLTRWFMNGCNGSSAGEIVGLAYEIF